MAGGKKSSSVPGPDDIISYRGRPPTTPGFLRYQKIIQKHIPLYNKTTGRKEKAQMTKDVLEIIKKDGARFFKKDEKSKSGWVELDDGEARNKISQALRLRTSSKSQSAQAKKASTNKGVKASETTKKMSKFPAKSALKKPAPVTKPPSDTESGWGASLWTSLKSNLTSLFSWREG